MSESAKNARNSENSENSESIENFENCENSENSDNSPLLEYQDALLELLSSGLPQNEILEALNSDSRFEHYRHYVSEFDPDMVAVACELMVQWSIRRD